MWVTVTPPINSIDAEIQIPGSKSISNRLLIIRAFCEEKFEIENLSTSDDTRILNELINSDSKNQNTGAGGTTFRFLLALRALQGKEITLSGSKEFNTRPISPLVNALRELGASITYLEKDGFAPVKVNASKMNGGKILIDANVSSQFVSALMMISPYLDGGLEILLTGNPVSVSYIFMTASLMKEFSVDVQLENNSIQIKQGNYLARKYSCTPDWTSASYWYGLISCTNESKIKLINLSTDKFQGDSILEVWMQQFSVHSHHVNSDIVISNNNTIAIPPNEIDFTNNPDLSLALAVVAAVKGISIYFTGLSTLKIKETDRLFALKIELEKTGVHVLIDDNSLRLSGKADAIKIEKSTFNTYEDHRMAMALSILVTANAKVKIANPNVVSKSYPNYFDQLKNIGFGISYEGS